MLPTEWKKEIEESNGEAQRRSDENRKREQDQQTASIATPLNSLRNHFKAYIKKQDRNEKSKTRREIATIAGLFVTAFFTLCLAGVGIAQVYTFIVSERGFVVPIETKFTNGLVVKENPLEISMTLKNKGKSIASIDVVEVAITHKLTPIPQYSTAKKIAYPPIAPNETFERSFGFKTGWPQETIDQLTNGTLDFFIFGRIKYRDDFSWFGSRSNGFCFQYKYVPTSRSQISEVCSQTEYTYSD